MEKEKKLKIFAWVLLAGSLLLTFDAYVTRTPLARYTTKLIFYAPAVFPKYIVPGWSARTWQGNLYMRYGEHTVCVDPHNSGLLSILMVAGCFAVLLLLHAPRQSVKQWARWAIVGFVGAWLLNCGRVFTMLLWPELKSSVVFLTLFRSRSSRSHYFTYGSFKAI